MSEQEFNGLKPKSKTGESIYFYSLDYWIDIRQCILMSVDCGFPPYPTMDAETAEWFAGVLQERLNFGLIQAYYELDAKRSRADTTSSDNTLDEEEAAHVDTIMQLTQDYIDFLKDCGGCEPVSVDAPMPQLR
jgi:hypothetical protein